MKDGALGTYSLLRFVAASVAADIQPRSCRPPKGRGRRQVLREHLLGLLAGPHSSQRTLGCAAASITRDSASLPQAERQIPLVRQFRKL